MKKENSMQDWIQKLNEDTLHKGIDRRSFLQGAGKVAGVSLGMVIAQSMGGLTVSADEVEFQEYPFLLGVASGDPLPDSVVLWTRLATDPLNGGGMADRNIPVKWEMAKDEHFRHIVQRGTEVASPALAHSVHAEVDNLEANTVYYYRFKVGKDFSPIGKTKTLPAQHSDVASLTFAFASCQQYEHGYYTAYKHMAKEDLDLVFHLGDYIYEYGPDEYVSGTGNVRTHKGPEIRTLEDYRNRHAQYRSDKDLQEAHAAFPWVVTWDDHEVENNYADLIPEKGQSVEAFVKRRVAAYQAYYEHMPLRKSSMPHGPDMQLYRQFNYGNLANFMVLDTRQYRSDQANGDKSSPQTEESLDPTRTLLGDEQEAWVIDQMEKSHTSWNILAQQIFFAKRNYGPSPDEPLYSMDGWDGYTPARERITEPASKKGMDNLIVLTGDVHANWASNILSDFDDPASQVLGAEFVGTSITSGGNGADKRADTDRILNQNEHIKFFNDYRGYVRCHVTPSQWRTDYRVVPFVTKPGADVSTRASFVYEKDAEGLKEVSTSAVPQGKQKSSEVEEDRHKAHTRAHHKQTQSNKQKQTIKR
ncbi:alkaline phosphatase D family protein [Halobacillus karajensis]|uniref:Alkaline phosphatase D n=1 Tax=Halobacillus karajensis TaxID=195088 RepID=A0A059NVL7_9BACI|nr:alkaline phosphatase D family protein [Halobacillus karajensis]CDQ18504.1 Alkaline phosphatase D precursor [Halobacillus karajensis]CDQ23424.1 Alkaline phosphatase D precursor [Halobacillus karajensis]CDQ26906.1 Alkaline phosphatase D precursor [Halobacillus karajensis]